MDEGNTAFSGGLYHGATGSRILYGIQDEWGLPARLRNPWARAVPFAENHRPTVNDLKTGASSAKEPAIYLYLGSPRIGPLRFFTSTLLGGGLNPAYGGGVETQFGKKRSLLFEGFYTDRKLSPREPAPWFSSSPPLPERAFRFYGAHINFTAPRLGIAADGAYSETFALGRGMYGNLGIRLGDKPWRLSLALDSAGSAYVDREGNAAGAGFRTAARVERRGTRNSLFRLSAVLRAPALGEAFDRNSGAVYYRFRASGNHLIRPSRVSLGISRDASEPGKPLDSVEGSWGLDIGSIRSTFQAALTGLAGAAGVSLPNPGGGYDFKDLKVSGELARNFETLQLRGRLGYAAEAKKDPRWEASASASFPGKLGRLRIRLASADFPHEWTWTISWRLSYGREWESEPGP
jgi:hypothetical protein